MPGASCTIVGCGACNGKHKGLSFFSIRQPKDLKWERELVHAVNRADTSKFNKDTAKICSRHFRQECVKLGPGGKKRYLLPGSLPTECILFKSIVTRQPPPRKEPVAREPPLVPVKVVYNNFSDVRKAASKLQAPWCVVLHSDAQVVAVSLTPTGIGHLQVSITPDLSAVVSVFGLQAPHLTANIESTHLSKHLTALIGLHVCPGVVDHALQKFAELPTGQDLYYRHVLYVSETSSITHSSTARSSTCHLLVKESSKICNDCLEVKNLLLRKQARAHANEKTPILNNNPLVSVSHKKLKQAFKTIRKQAATLKLQLENFKKSLKTDSVIVSDTLHESLISAIDKEKLSNESKLTKLFWAEQQKAFQVGKKGMRWHPTMIRLAILLHSRSPAAYETLRATGVLRLPGESTLRDYTNVFHPNAGFRSEVLESIRNETKNYRDSERFVVLLHDEMTITSDLVFDRRSSELVGYVTGSSGDLKNIATHALLFYVVGVNTNLSKSVGFFGTKAVTADALYPLFWRAVGLLETYCFLKVIASTSDKASPNQRLVDMHGTPGSICYKTMNLFAQQREIYFFSDAPHLVKTVRNNLSCSGSGKNTRFLWQNGCHLLWQHVVAVYNSDCAQVLRRTRLTADHIHLTPQSVMNVKLAAQVLSERVGKVMLEMGRPEMEQTAKFILLMDRFFDCMNSRSLTEAQQKNKSDIAPYRNVMDERFAFFEELHSYLVAWKEAVQRREGNFSQTERNKMFLSHQTFKGLCTTLKAFPEATRYLLSSGVEYVLSNRFCQDPIEQHFGRQRGLGRRCDNPNLWMFGYNENKLATQRSLALTFQPRGNVAAKRKVDVEISTSPMKKMKR